MRLLQQHNEMMLVLLLKEPSWAGATPATTCINGMQFLPMYTLLTSSMLAPAASQESRVQKYTTLANNQKRTTLANNQKRRHKHWGVFGKSGKQTWRLCCSHSQNVHKRKRLITGPLQAPDNSVSAIFAERISRTNKRLSRNEHEREEQ